jgi:hypothetical protein
MKTEDEEKEYMEFRVLRELKILRESKVLKGHLVTTVLIQRYIQHR